MEVGFLIFPLFLGVNSDVTFGGMCLYPVPEWSPSDILREL